MIRTRFFLAALLPVVFCDVVPDISLFYNSFNTSDSLSEINYLNNVTAIHQALGTNFVSDTAVVSQEDDDIGFNILNRANTTLQRITLSQVSAVTSLTSFNTSLRTVFVIHGWHNTINSTFNAIISETLLEIGDFNIIIIDWDEESDGLYLTAYRKVPHVGKVVGKFVLCLEDMFGYSMDDVQLIGHSLGAHISGYAGQETNGSIRLIVGLDPAGPLYFELFADFRLSEDDAQYVQAIHTSAGTLGVNFNVGDSDFWPNGGSIQPGCGVDISCYHGRSYYYFNESLTTPMFEAQECDSYLLFTTDKCANNTLGIMGGEFINTSLNGTYFLGTNSSYPYALGESGL